MLLKIKTKFRKPTISMKTSTLAYNATMYLKTGKLSCWRGERFGF
jgi:hypothetical protein